MRYEVCLETVNINVPTEVVERAAKRHMYNSLDRALSVAKDIAATITREDQQVNVAVWIGDDIVESTYPYGKAKCCQKEYTTYYVTFRIDARFVAGVSAKNLEEARAKAEEVFIDADFGDAVDIDGEPTIIEDEAGNYVWERQYLDGLYNKGRLVVSTSEINEEYLDEIS